MKSEILMIILFLFSIPLVHAQDFEIEKMEIVLDINPDNSVSQSTAFIFSSRVSGSFTYKIADKANDIRVFGENGDLKFDISQVSDGYLINISFDRPSKLLHINYKSDNRVFRTDSINYFFTEFSFEKPVRNMTVNMTVPEGYQIYQNFFRPSDSKISSDGNRIIIIWEGQNVESSISFAVKFQQVYNQSGLLIGVLAIIAGVAAIIYFYFRERLREEFMQGFRQDEQKTIEYLRENKTALQSDLQKQFGFSRAKATRIVYSLEQKGLLSKQKYGRTNKLFWLKR